MNFEQLKHLTPHVKTILVRIKLIILIITTGCVQLSADVFGQRVTLDEHNATLTQILRKIEKQSGYTFFYNRKDVRDLAPINLSVNDESVANTLEKLFKNRPYGFEIQEKIIILNKKETPYAPERATALAPEPVMQQQEVAGRVTDSLGNPLERVSVLVQGSDRGTATDVAGQYRIQAAAGDVLVFRNVGYLTQQITVGQQTLMDVVLKMEQSDLDEVVIVAYGAQKKATLTGAISTISTKEIKQSPAANLAVTLAGRLPGLFAQQVSGEPGRDATLLFMRGRGTLNGSSPIILVDGVERELTSIDPNEVESVSILKDASSTALFGVRGANGVILITTKRGTETTPAIGLTAEAGMQAFSRRPTSLESHDWALLKNEAWHNDNPDPGVNQFPPYSDYALERYRLQDQPEAYANNDWMGMLMKKWVPQTRYNLTVNGKGANVGYFVNVGFLDQAGQWNIDKSVTDYDPSQYMKRYNFRSNIDAILNKSRTLKMFLNASGSLEKVNGPFVATNDIVSRILNRWPSIQSGPLTPDGEVLVGESNYGESPWAQINRTGYKKESRSSITASWGMDQDFSFLTEGLSARVMLSFDTKSLHYLNAATQHQYWVQIIDPNTQTADGRDSVYYQRTRTDFDNTPLNTSISANFQSFYDIQFQTNYNRVFNGKHAVTGLFLATQQALIKPTDALPFNVRGLATRMTYSFDNKYIVEFNAGFNGSEQFAKGRRYGFFPSISAGWNIQNEAFFENYRNTIDLLKIRGSYGSVGGDQLGSRRFLYLDDIKRGGGSYSGTLGRGANIQESFFGNPNVQWEVAKKVNLGVEVGLFNQLTLTGDFFTERRDNVLIYRGSIPMIIGVSPSAMAPANIGIIENKGYELELNYHKTFHSDLSIISKINFNYANNKILFNDEVQLDEDYAYRYRSTGYQIGQQWGYNSLGFFNSQEEIDAYGVEYQGRKPRPGDLKFEDLNGDNKIDDKDVMPIGESSVPKYSWGAAANIIYKNFDVSFLFQGAFKVSGLLGPWEWYDFRTRHQHAWTAERAASGEEIRFPALSLTQSSSQIGNNTYFNENRSFIRLKNVEIGYMLPKSLTEKVAIKSLRIYVNGLNLMTWDKMGQVDWDPELRSTDSYPIYKVLNAGINVTF